MPNVINYPLKHKPIKYAGGNGHEIECSHVELRAPTGRVSHLVCGLEGLVQSALLSMADSLDDDVKTAAKEAAENKPEGAEDEEKDGDGIMTVLASSGGDMQKVILHCRELFKEVAWMGGEKLITSARLDDLDHRDLRGMCGAYIANFVLS